MRSGSGRGSAPAGKQPSNSGDFWTAKPWSGPHHRDGRSTLAAAPAPTRLISPAGDGAVGIDNQHRALQIARARAAASGTDVTFVHGDVTALRAGDIGAPADFFLDVGCFHHLPGPGRQAMAGCVTAAAAPDAILLMLAFNPARRGPLPPGASREEIETAFGGWKILADEPADTSGMPRALQGSAPRWYRLRLSQP